MLLDELVSVIETLKQRIREHGSRLRENETRTRMALIDPLLQTLGWDTADPGMVIPEYKVVKEWADYALLGRDVKPVAIVEAKKLGEPSSEKHLTQMVSYCTTDGIKYAGLTDGDRWELYEVFKPIPLEEKRILKVSIADRPSHESALQLLLLWRSNLRSGQPVPASKPVLTAVHTERTPSPDALRIPTPATLPSGWVALSNYDPQPGTASPSAIRFSDGSESPIRNWKNLLVVTIGWLYESHLLTEKNAPVNIVNTSPENSRGTRFRRPTRVDRTPFLFEANASGKMLMNKTKELLRHCGQNLGDIFVLPRP